VPRDGSVAGSETTAASGQADLQLPASGRWRIPWSAPASCFGPPVDDAGSNEIEPGVIEVLPRPRAWRAASLAGVEVMAPSAAAALGGEGLITQVKTDLTVGEGRQYPSVAR
jgi:hypothetical protein